jgi:Tol biopolymer transport system component
MCVVQKDGTSNVYLLPQGDVTTARQVTYGKENGSGGVAWTNDGRLVYASEEGGNPDVWICDSGGSNKRQLTTDTLWDAQPSVSADGTFMLFTSGRSGIPNIWRMGIDGSRVKQLTTGGEDYRPDISPDGTWCVFDSWDSGPDVVMKLSTDGGTPVQVSDSNGSGPVISPDGKLIAYNSYSLETGIIIHVIPAGGGTPHRQFPLPSFATPNIRWMRDGMGFSYIDTRQGVSNVWVQALAGGAPRQVTTFTSDLLSNHAWSPDGKTLAVARTSVTSDVLLMSAER